MEENWKRGIQSMTEDQKRLHGGFLRFADYLMVAEIRGKITNEQFKESLDKLQSLLNLLMPIIKDMYTMHPM